MVVIVIVIVDVAGSIPGYVVGSVFVITALVGLLVLLVDAALCFVARKEWLFLMTDADAHVVMLMHITDG